MHIPYKFVLIHDIELFILLNNYSIYVNFIIHYTPLR